MSDEQGPDETFGSYVRRLRMLAGLEGTELANRLGVSAPHLSRVEANRKAPVDPEKWGPLLELGAAPRILTDLTDRYYGARARRRGGRISRKDRERLPAGHPGSLSWEDLPWEDDDCCWYAVAHHPDGLSQDEVAALTGWSNHKVEQLEQSALAKLRENPEALEALGSLYLLRQSRDSTQMPPLSAQR